jgi:hypothetical protein
VLSGAGFENPGNANAFEVKTRPAMASDVDTAALLIFMVVLLVV